MWGHFLFVLFFFNQPVFVHQPWMKQNRRWMLAENVHNPKGPNGGNIGHSPSQWHFLHGLQHEYNITIKHLSHC